MNNYLYIEAPFHPELGAIKNWQKTIFLAGSITGAVNWQLIARNKLCPHFNVFNPRRFSFDVTNPNEERTQIQWEHSYLNAVEIIFFHFSKETLAPISLFELGAMLEQQKVYSYKKIYISIDPEYKRKNDIYIQTELRNPRFLRNIYLDLNTALDVVITNHSNTKAINPAA